MAEFSEPRHEFEVAITCSGCGRTGRMTWEGTERRDHAELVGVPDGFYERVSRKAPYPIELVCAVCGTVQVEKTQ